MSDLYYKDLSVARRLECHILRIMWMLEGKKDWTKHSFNRNGTSRAITCAQLAERVQFDQTLELKQLQGKPVDTKSLGRQKSCHEKVPLSLSLRFRSVKISNFANVFCI